MARRNGESRDVSATMRAVRCANTLPERKLRQELKKAGVQLHCGMRSILGKPDFIVNGKKVAIFVDGDFWHGHQWLLRGYSSIEEHLGRLASHKYWIKKIRRNVERDIVVTRDLTSAGWKVLRFWESDILRDSNGCVNMTLRALSDWTFEPARLSARTVAEFFAGIGLVRMGLASEGWNVIFANDNDADKFEMYSHQFGNDLGNYKVKDVHDLNPNEIPDVTLATASFPCNDLSLAGSRGGLAGAHSSAFWGFAEAIKGMGNRKPPLILLENVVGFLSSNNGRDFLDVLRTLNKLGYRVDCIILDAAGFVPQSRQRMFVVGLAVDLCERINSPEPSLFSESTVRPRALADYVLEHPEINWYHRKLPPHPISRRKLKSVIQDPPASSSEWWSTDRANYLLSQMSPKHLLVAKQMIAGENWSYGTVFRRVRNGKSMAELRTDGIAGCLRTPRGGSGRQILFKAGFGKFFVRLLSPRECARLMGADSYRIGEAISLNQALFGFGDAVCVPAISWIARYYLNPVISEALRTSNHSDTLDIPAREETDSRHVEL